ncbi:MAG TPA: membrane dipeptidase [bacterium]|jgi:membrane dipeptidase|nr:membrane dipeptidase [bacterium]HPG45379.1 membrane dipeptidase [bacterium]HPM96845.1 membrane dipeptidase [bacterium]
MSLPMCDLHCDTATRIVLGVDLCDASLEVNLPAMRRGNVLLQVFAFYIPPSFPVGFRFATVAKMIEKFRVQIEPYSDEIAIATSADQIMANVRKGRISAVLAVENGNAIENDLRNLEKFHDLGVRLLTLIHAKSNDWAISSNDSAPAFDGLTDFGGDVVRVLNDLGMIIDLSHAHDRTAARVLELSAKPVVASHSCVHALCPVPRNLRDELIEGIGSSGGVIGINLFPSFLDIGYHRFATARGGELFDELSRRERQAGTDVAEIDRLFQEFKVHFQKVAPNTEVGLARVIDHIDYIASRFGDDRVTLGSDFDGLPILPVGVHDCGAYAELVQLMISRGYPEQRLQKICWDNFVRVFRSCCG